MIRVDLIQEMILGEPGPNLFWYGPPSDYLELILALHTLGESNDVTITDKDIKHLVACENCRLTMRSKEKAKSLCILDGTSVTIELDRNLW